MYVANVNTGLEYLSVQRFCKPFCEMVSKKYGIKIILDTLYPKITFKAVLEKYGYPIISKEVAQCIFEARKGIANGDGTYSYRIQKLNGTYKDKNGNLSPYNCSKYKFLLDAPFKISHLCCHEMKKHPAYEYEALTGRIPLIATTTEESRARKSAWLKHGCNVFDAFLTPSAHYPHHFLFGQIMTYLLISIRKIFLLQMHMAKLFRRMMGLMDRSTCLKKSDMKAAGLKQRDAQEQAVFTVCLE